MKRILCLGTFAAFGLIFSVNVDAQDKSSKKEVRDKHTYERALDKEAQKKVLKEARRETKMLRKEGFEGLQGKLPMNRQLENFWQKQMEVDANGVPCWYIASSRAIGKDRPDAALQATAVVKTNLAEQIRFSISQRVQFKVEELDMTAEEYERLIEIIGASRNTISDALERTIPLIEVYRTLSNDEIEAMVCLGYGAEAANKVAISAIRDELIEKSDPLAVELDKLGY